MPPADDHLPAECLPASQQEIRARCQHPTGAWEPFDGLRAEISLPARLHAVAARHPERAAVLDLAGTLTYEQLIADAGRVAGAILDGGFPGPVRPERAAPGGGAVAILSSL